MTSLAALRNTTAAVDRARQKLDTRYWRMFRPGWCTPDDPLYEVFANQKLLRSEGTVVWGVIVQANEALFDPLDDISGAPATVIYSRTVDQLTLGKLKYLARRLLPLRRHTRFKDAEQLRYGQMLADEYTRAIDFTVPESMTDGEVVYSTSVYFPKKHLEGNVLAFTYFPLLIHEKTFSTMLVPHRYWDKSFRAKWKKNIPDVDPVESLGVARFKVTERLVLGLGWLYSIPGALAMLVALVLLYAAFGELRYSLQAAPAHLDAQELDLQRNNTYVQFKSELNYPEAMIVWDRKKRDQATVVPVSGESNVYVVMPVSDPPKTTVESTVTTGRLGHRPWNSHHNIGEFSAKVGVKLAARGRPVSDSLVLIVADEHPISAVPYFVMTGLLLSFVGFMVSRLIRAYRFVRNDAALADFLARLERKGRAG